MRYGCKKILSTVIAAMLCAVMLVGTVPAVGAQEARSVAPLSDPDRFDFAVPWAEDNVTLSASELFVRLFSADGVQLSDAEQAYLDERLYTLTYNDTIPGDAVQTFFDETAATLDVTVPPYSYTAVNGDSVSWIPQTARIGDTVKQLVWNGTAYVCQFTDMEQDADFDMDVSFVQTVNFSSDVIETMLTQSQTDGAAARQLLEQYAADCAAYQRAYSAYRAWIEYPAKRAARDEYDRKYAEYTEKKAEYDAYIADAESYEARVAEYEAYLVKKAEYEAAWDKYEEYKTALSKYQAEYNKYIQYCDQVAAAEAQLSIMESLFVSDSHFWQLYATIQGPTVDNVVNGMNEIMNASGLELKKKQISDAGESTKVLRTVLKGYADIRKDKKNAPENEKNKALHDYYRANYTVIKHNFRKLYEALYKLYSEGVVSDYIESQGKEEHFQQFLGQLYITVCCLDDQEALKMSWTPTSHLTTKTLDVVVEACQLVKDNVKADPTDVTYPATAVTEPDPLEEVKVPVAPTVVREPDVPVPVSKPTEPAFVEDPGEEPPRAEDPGEAPAEPVLSEALTVWAGCYDEVDYQARQALIGPRSIELTATVTRNVSVRNLHRVRFYSHDGVLLDCQEFETGADLTELLIYPDVPDREASEQYVYEFADWYRFDGTALNQTTIHGDLSLRAAYERYLCQYEITWKIDGKVVKVERWDYGTTPVYEVANRVEGKYDYVFSGWTPTVVPVTSNATYAGYFQKILRTHTVTWKLDGGKRVETARLAEGVLPTYEGVKDYVKNNYWYAFAGWDATVVPITADVTYTATYRDPVLFSSNENGDSNVSVSVKNGVVTAEMLENTVEFENLCTYAQNCGYELVLMRNTVSIRLDADALASLKASGCRRIRFAREEDGLANGTSYSLSFMGSDDGVLNTDASVTVEYRYTSMTNGSPACYEFQNGEWTALESTRQGGVLSAARVGGGTFWCGTAFYILYDPVETCNTLALPDRAVAGTWVELGDASCAYGYEITEILLTLEDGSVLSVDGNGFEMPQGAVNVTLSVEQIVYHVSFVVNGKVIAQGDYFLGDKVEIPADPTLELGDGLVYSFTGWSPSVTLAGGEERNIVYTAQFISGAPITDEEQRAMESNDILVRIVIIAVVFVAVIVGVIALIVFIRRRKRR